MSVRLWRRSGRGDALTLTRVDNTITVITGEAETLLFDQREHTDMSGWREENKEGEKKQKT